MIISRKAALRANPHFVSNILLEFPDVPQWELLFL